MANGIASGLEDILGLETNAGTGELQQAIQALQSVNVPSIAQLTLPELQKYVQAGVLTPQQYQAISADPQAYQAVASQADQSGNNAQKAALQQLGGIVNAGGSTAINQANLLNNVQQTNQAMQAARGGIEQNAQQRGVSGGGLEFISKLMNEQQNAQNANLGATNAAADNARLALQAMTNQGQLGGQLQGQSNQMAQSQAQAAQQVAEYNSQLQSAANQYNTQNANSAQAANLTNAQNIGNMNTQNMNTRTQYNAGLPQQQYQDEMQKAAGLAGAYGNMANLKQQQAASQNQFVGGLIGAGATLGGDYMMSQAMPKSGALPTGGGYGSGPSTASNATQSKMRYETLGYADGGEVSDEDAHNAAMRLMQSGKYADKNEHEISVSGPATRNEIYQSPSGKRHAAQVMTAAHGGQVPCYAQGGEAHDHSLCMKAGGTVPGEAEVPGDSTENDTVPAMLSPHEIVLPRSVSQAPDAPQQAAQFVGGIKGQQAPLDFSAILKQLEDNGLELRLTSKGI